MRQLARKINFFSAVHFMQIARTLIFMLVQKMLNVLEEFNKD